VRQVTMKLEHSINGTVSYVQKIYSDGSESVDYSRERQESMLCIIIENSLGLKITFASKKNCIQYIDSKNRSE